MGNLDGKRVITLGPGGRSRGSTRSVRRLFPNLPPSLWQTRYIEETSLDDMVRTLALACKEDLSKGEKHSVTTTIKANFGYRGWALFISLWEARTGRKWVSYRTNDWNYLRLNRLKRGLVSQGELKMG